MAHADLKAVGERQHGLAPLRQSGLSFASQHLLSLEFTAFRFEGSCTPLVDFASIGSENLYCPGHVADFVRAVRFGDLDVAISSRERAHPRRHSIDGVGDEALAQYAGEQCHGDAGCRGDQNDQDRAERCGLRF